MGLSAKAGIKRLFGGNTGASFVPGWAGTSDKRYETVPISTLDLIVNTRFNAQPILVKIDVEGYEYEVLNGAEYALGLSPRPVWLVEICLSENFPDGWNDKFRDTFDYSGGRDMKPERPIARSGLYIQATSNAG